MSASVVATAVPAPDAVRLPRSTLWGLLLSTALVPLGSTMIAVALPAIGRELSVQPGALTQWLVNSYLLVAIVLQSPAGKLADLWGTRRALLLGQALFAAGAALGFVGSSLGVLVTARVAMAAGGSLLVPASMALLRNATSPARRARLFGAFGASMGLAAALGPLLGGVLVETFGWRALFLVNIPILAAAAPLVRTAGERAAAGRAGRAPAGSPAAGSASARGAARPGGPTRPTARFDWIGSLILAAGLLSAVAGSKSGGAAALALLGLGAALLFAFVQWERRAADPVVDPRLFRYTAFAAGGSIVALHNLVMYALLFQLPIWLQAQAASGAANVGTLLLAMMLSMVVCSPLGGRLSERFGARAVALAGTASATAGLLLLTRFAPGAVADAAGALVTGAGGGGAGAWSAAIGAAPALVLLGAGLGLASAPAQSSAVSAIAPEQSGMAAGALSTMRYLGGVVGIGALGFILRDVALHDAGTALVAHQRAVWLFCGVMMLAAVPAALLPARRPADGGRG